MVGLSTKEIDIKEHIEKSKISLERVNDWINSFDTKAETGLALVGVLLTLIFTNGGLSAMYELFKKVFPPKSFCTILYITFFVIAAGILLYGLAHLIFVLVAKIDMSTFSEVGLETNSVLFFGSISKRPLYKDFYHDMTTQSKEDYLNDLISQIYINSKIAADKYLKYNRGIKWTFIGFIAFILIFVMGIYLY